MGSEQQARFEAIVLNSTMTRKNRPPALISRTEYEVSHSIRDIIRQRSKEERAAESKSRVKRIMDTPFASENHQATDASSKAANKIGGRIHQGRKYLTIPIFTTWTQKQMSLDIRMEAFLWRRKCSLSMAE